MATISKDNVDMAQIMCTVGAPKQSTIKVRTSNGIETKTVTTLENSLYRCCTRAKVGGLSGYAFKIPENGYTRNDGELIDGAEPYWNIWSGISPGQWDIKLPDGTMYLRLRRDTPSSKEYSCKKGFFAGYNPAAKKPYLFPEGSTIYVPQNQGSIAVGITIFWDFGEIDWTVPCGNYTHIHVMAGKELYYAHPVIDEYIAIEDYNILGHYTVETTQNALGGIPEGGKLYFWGEFSMGEGNKICDFPTTSYGIIHWGEYWAKNVLGDITTVIQSTPSFVTATNYTVTSKEMTDADTTTQNVRFNLTKTGNDSREIDTSRSYIRCKWRDKNDWQDCPTYKIELPPEVNFTRTQYCTLPIRSGIGQEFIIDIQLVLVYK